MKHSRVSTSYLGPFALSLGVALSAATSARDAVACGGLFCSNANPVNQTAERIVFAKNDDDTVSAAIEIQYQGPSHEFAWVLPVPDGDVEIGVSSTIAFDRLQQQSNPLYRLNVTFESCPSDGQTVVNADGSIVTVNPTSGAVPPGNTTVTVTVLDQGNAGPYDFVIISVDETLDDPADVAVNWLGDNDYEVGDIGPETLRPYLEEGMNLIAFRLTKGQDSGAIRPVLIKYPGDQPSIPILPTAVAADPDMGIMVWVLGDGRAIPSNYLHLELNEAMINWFNPTPTYNDVIIAAADEAGGHGFVTEQSGAAGQFSEAIYASWEQDQWQRLRTGSFGSILEFLESAAAMFGSYDGFADLMRDPDVVPLREGATGDQLMACMRCYFEQNVAVRNEAYPETPYDPETDPLLAMDVLAFLDRMDELVITPLAETRALFDDHERVTRFYTTLSPDEMTMDPTFDFNAELPDIDNNHVADQIFQCGGTSEWRVELPQGMTLYGSGNTWPVGLDDEEFPVNFRVVQLATEGDGDVVDDNTASIGVALAELGIGDFGDSMSNDTGDDGAMDATPGPDFGDIEPVSTGLNDPNQVVDDTLEPDASTSSGGCQLSASAATQRGASWLLVGAALVLARRRRVARGDAS